MLSCPNCGSAVPIGARFCPQCAAPIPRAPSPPLADRPLPSSPGGATRSWGALPRAARPPVGSPGSPAPSPPQGRSPTGLLPPTIALLAGETVDRQYEMDLDGFRRVMRRNQTFMLALMLAIFLPFMVLIGFTASSPAKAAFGLGLFGVIIVLLLVVMLVAGRGGRTTPTIVHVTNRRILVENTGKGESSGSISLDSLGDVVLESKGAAKSAGLSWVFLLPLGTTTLRIGSGRVQMLAPGVLVIPAVSTVRAEELRSYVLERARALQAAPAPSAPLA